MKELRQGFTIVELLMVVGVIAVLMTIVTTASQSALRSSREKRRDAMRVALQSAITTYQASDSNGKWPSPIESASEEGVSKVLSDEDAQRVFRIVVQKSTGESGSPLPLIDPHGLFVAAQGAVDGKSTGMPFDDARQGDGRRRKLPVAQMVFGYQGKMTGKFRSFRIVYHAETDSVSVHDCCEKCLSVNGCTRPPTWEDPCQYCHGVER